MGMMQAGGAGNIEVFTSKNEQANGDNTTHTRTVAVKKGETWLFVTFAGSNTGTTNNLTTPNSVNLLNVNQDVVRWGSGCDVVRNLKVRICKFTANATVTCTCNIKSGWAACYFGFFKINT